MDDPLVIACSTPHTQAAGLGLTRPACVSVTRSPCQLSASDFQMPTTISGKLSKLQPLYALSLDFDSRLRINRNYNFICRHTSAVLL